MWHKNNRRRGFLGHLKSLFAQTPERNTRKSRNVGPTESLESRIVLTAQFVENHVLITLGNAADSSTSETMTRVIPGSEAKPLGSYGVFLMTLPAGVSVPSAIATLREQPGVLVAEPDWIGEWAATPNDPSYNNLWGMQNTGQTVNGTAGTLDADIDADLAWDRTTGSSSIIAAIVDSGVDHLHPDLAGNMWVNAAEIAGNNIDDDNNGFVDDVNGFDFGSGDSNPMDFVGHGTHVAGTVGAVGDNGSGVAGVNWDVSLMALKIGTDTGGPTSSGAIAAINYAVAMGATVSNHSYTVPRSVALENAVINARDNNHIIVAAAGNSSRNNDFLPSFPASFSQDNVIAVAATDSADQLAGFSNFGVNSVDIGAPGVDIFSTVPTAGSIFYPTPNYEFSDGTSMASPMVAGAVALLRSVVPTIPYTQVISALYQGADRLPSLAGRVATGARLNVNNALDFLKAATFSVSPSSIAENAGAGAATITIRKANFPVNQALTLDLFLSDASEVSIPALGAGTQVVIPAGQTQISMSVTAVDDNLLDGTQTVIFDLHFQSVSIATATLDVTDHESVSIVANPDSVFENAGANAGTLTVSRSNTDVFAPARVAAVNNELRFFNRSGAQVNASVPVPWPTGVRPAQEKVRDVTTMEDGRIAVFNGTSIVYMSLYSPTSGNWTHRLISGASASPGDDGTGGISTVGSMVFLSDLETSSGDPFGLVRIDVNTGTITRFGTRSFGDRLFASNFPADEIVELNPANGNVLRTMSTPPGSGEAGMAFDGRYLWYVTQNSDTLYKLDADTGSIVDTYPVGSSTNSGFTGLAYMNGYVYLLDPFITDEIVIYDPVMRSTIARLPVGVANGLDLSGGLAPNPARNSLYVTATFSDIISEISATNGRLMLKPDGSPRQFSSGDYWDAALATVGDKLYVGVDRASNIPIRILSLDGAPQSTIPWNEFFGVHALAGDGIKGLVPTSNRYRDMIIGLDGGIYALDTAGLILGKFDSTTLEPISFLTLEEPVQSIAVDAAGVVYGGTATGDIVGFNAVGKVTKRLASGIGLVSDLEVNISGDILAGSSTGMFAYSTTALSASAAFPSGFGSTVFMTFGEHASRNRGELIVTITNSDVSELRAPLTVIIPEGQQSVTVPFDAVDDNIRDGLQLVTLSVSATGYNPGSDTVAVDDFEQFSVDVEALTIAESQGTAATRVKVSRTDIDGPYGFRDVQNYANDTLVNLLDNGTVTSVINVPSQISRIADVDVTINLSHQWLADLDVYLISPSGTRVELFTDLNTNANVMSGTVIDDQGGESIVDKKDSFTGRFMPEEAFSKLLHERAYGNWTLEITDDNVSDFGVLTSWSLTLYTEGLEAATITLQSSALDEAGFGGQSTRQIVIPANQSEVYVDLDAVDDSILDGPQNVTVTATNSNVLGLTLGSDQVIVTDDETLIFSISRTTVSEAAGAGAVTGTLTRFNTDRSLPYLVTLSSSDTSELTVPVTVTIPANQTSVTFPINAVDDLLIDGTQLVTITAMAPEYGSDLTAQISVEDLEASLALSASGTVVREDSATMEITITRLDQADISQAMTVSLSSVNVPAGGPATISVPASITIPPNAASVTFTVTVVDDQLLDGTQTGKITATANGMISGEILVNVTDVETLTVTVNKTEFLENAGAGAATGTVTRSNTNRSQPLTVTLTSSDLTELTVPTTVTIPANAASVTFPITAINDPDLDGPQTVQITATAASYFSTSATVTVQDHEPPVILTPTARITNPLPTITWSAIPGAIRYEVQVSNLSAGIPFLIYRTVTGNSLTPVENLGIGRYRVWVRAIDSLERAGVWSNPREFRIETAPRITAPSLTGTIASTTFPEIAWTAVADAVRYELWVNNVTSKAVRVISQTNLTTSSYKATELLGSGRYTAFVRAFNNSSEFGLWSEGYSFTVLSTPGIIQPTTGGTFDRTPTITWNAIPGATNYDVWVSSRTTNAIVLRNQNVTGTSLTPAKDMATGDYTVWVRAQSGQYFSPWSAGRSFSIGMPPKINSPTSGTSSTARPTFLWSSVSGTERYELWITNVQTNTKIVLTNLTSTSYTPSSNLARGNYRVWVRAVSFMGETTEWSTPVSFTIAENNAPVQSLSISPDDVLLTSLLSGGRAETKVLVKKKQTEAPVVTEKNADVSRASRTPAIIHAASVAVINESEAEAFDSVMESWGMSEWWAPATAVNSSEQRSHRTAEKAVGNLKSSG